MSIKISDNVALLAPVPSMHLESALETLSEAGGVLFASNAYQTFYELETAREGLPVSVWIYESFGDSKLVVKWKGTYVGFVSDNDRGQLKLKKQMRPKSTADDRRVAVYWQLSHLEKLENPFQITDLFGLGSKKPFKSTFVPRGPTLIKPRA